MSREIRRRNLDCSGIPKNRRKGKKARVKGETGRGFLVPERRNPRLQKLDFIYIRGGQKNDAQESGVEVPGYSIASQVFENTWHSIVMIRNKKGQGSGVIIRPGLVATNFHVIEGGDVLVYPSENKRINKNAPFSVEIVHQDESQDFCVLGVRGLSGVPAKIRRYDTLKVGENVYALGAPRGLDMSLSDGLISQLRRAVGGKRYIQTNAAISPGSSGGGLFDAKGNFIGIPTKIYVGKATQGIAFAIPADLALEF